MFVVGLPALDLLGGLLGEDAADGGGVVDDGEGGGRATEGIGRREEGDDYYGGGGGKDDWSHLREWELLRAMTLGAVLVPFIGGNEREIHLEREREKGDMRISSQV